MANAIRFLKKNIREKMNLWNWIKATDSYDIRRYMALLFMAGGSMAFTIIVCVILFTGMLTSLGVFWIAMSSMGLILLMQTGFVALVAKREIKWDKDGNLFIKDQMVKDV